MSALQKIHIDRQIIVKITVPSDVTFPGDSNDLLEVLGNLLDNGFKYAKSTISVNVSTRNNKLIITIEDDGNGLLSEDCMIIFNRGLRIDETPNGQGLGLSIVKNVIESYHGSIEASTSPLGGARFMIEIPLRTHNENN
ncbi:ATP-binding protein [Pseudomonas sp. HK3]